MSIRRGKYFWTRLNWRNQYHSLTMLIWVAPKENVRWGRILFTITRICLNPAFLMEEIKITRTESFREFWDINHIFLILWYGGSCKEISGKILRTDEQNNSNSYTKSQRHAQIVLKCSYLTRIDLIFDGPWTTLLVRSRNGVKLVINVWRVWSHTFIFHVNSVNIVWWETQQNTAD